MRQEHGAARIGERGLTQVTRRVDATELGSLEQRVEGRGDLGPSLRLRPEVVPPTDDRTADAALGGVVVEGDPSVVEESDEAVPVRDDVRGGVADRERLQLQKSELDLTVGLREPEGVR